MPIFDYECKCGATIDDKLVKSSETKVECPQCGEFMGRKTTATKYLLLCGEGFEKQHDKPNPNW